VGVVLVSCASEALREFAQLVDCSAPGTVFILEEYIEGPEFGVELVMEAGTVVFCSVMEAAKQSWGQSFQGTGRSFPCSQGALVQASIASHCIAAVRALGLTTGVIDIDVRHSKVGPRILEVNARMGGGSVLPMHDFVYNLDLMEAHVQTLLGVSVAKLAYYSLPRDPTVCYEAGWVMSPHSGSIQGMDAFLEELRVTFADHEEVVSITKLLDDGNKVVGYSEGLPTCLIQVLARGTSKMAAEEKLCVVLRKAEDHIAQLVPRVADASAAGGTGTPANGAELVEPPDFRSSAPLPVAEVSVVLAAPAALSVAVAN